MTDLFKNKYRIPSARLKDWEYGAQESYFITICIKNRQNLFGEIREGAMELSEIGLIAETEWKKTLKLRSDMNLKLGEYVVMPNHFHGIIIIGENKYNTQRRDVMHCVSTSKPQSKNKFGPQSKNLASVIRGFKIGITKNARMINPGFAWQSRFYDHVIRDQKDYDRIHQYIINNPAKWQENKFKR